MKDPKSEIRNLKQIQEPKAQKALTFGSPLVLYLL